MRIYLSYPLSIDGINESSKERSKLSETEFLTFMKVDNELKEEEIVFDGSNIKCMNYIANQFKKSKKNSLDLGKNNLKPIIKAFKDKKID